MKKQNSKNRAKKSGQIPVTVELLFQVRDQLETKIESVVADVSGLRDDMKKMEAHLDSKMDSFIAEIRNLLAKQSVENREQDARSLYVLDSYNILEARVTKIEKEVFR